MVMRSIRLSLIVYFALLLTCALTAVSGLVYQTTAHSLEEQRRATQKLIEEQFQTDSTKIRTALDQQLLRRALILANRAHTVPLSPKWFAAVAAVGSHSGAPGSWPDLLTLASVEDWITHKEVFHWPREEIHIEGAEHLVPELEWGTDFFQTYSMFGRTLQRSESLEEHSFTLEPGLPESTGPLKERFDNLDLAGVGNLRRVTLKTNVTRIGFTPRPFPRERGEGFKGPPQLPTPPNNPGRMTANIGRPVPTFFIQYAADRMPMENQLADIRRERDEQLGQVARDTHDTLRQLGTRLFWIGLVALTALWFGGFLLVRFGLSPLERLTEAVSRVSPKDFRLNVDSDQLPTELQPIANRLGETLQQLREAFEREKQAAADISHELRTPLASLMTTVEVALRKPRTAQEYQEILEECRLSGSHMAQLVERLLALARLDAGAVPYRPREVDVASLTVECADMVRPLARARSLELRVDATPPLSMQTDPDKVREILTNLLHNAIEYNRDGGAIDVAVRRVNGHLELAVADTGIGISAEARPHIFERFYRADPSRHADTPHAGLGLSIVKSYVDLMGGQISVESRSDGSTFRVELPCDKQ